MAEKNMNAKISVEFEETANRQQLSSGDSLPTLFGKTKKFFSDLKPVALSGSYNDLTDIPKTTEVMNTSEVSNSITITDATETPLISLTVYGKSTQGYASHGSEPLGKNLIDPMKVVKNGLDADTGGEIITIARVRTGFIKAVYTDNHTHIIPNGFALVSVYNYDSNKNFLGFNYHEEGCYLRFLYKRNDELEITEDDLETLRKSLLFSTETDIAYEPYYSNPNPDCPVPIESIGDSGSLTVTTQDGTAINIADVGIEGYGIPVDTGGNYTDSNGQQWVCDELVIDADGTGKIIKHIRKTVVDGINITGIVMSYNETTGMTQWNYGVGLDFYILPDTIFGIGMCSHAKHDPRVDGTYMHFVPILDGENKYMRCWFQIGKATSTELNEWLKENPVTFIYQLATPTETELTAEQLTALQSVIDKYGAFTAYFMSTQDGIPAPENPVEIVSTADLHKFATAEITTGLPLRGIHVSSGGNYTDSNSQEWICDTLIVNADGSGKIVKNTSAIVFSGNERFNIVDDRLISAELSWLNVPRMQLLPQNTAQAKATALFSAGTVGSQATVYSGTDVVGFSEWSNVQFIYFSMKHFTDVDSFKAFLKTAADNGSPVTLAYLLETPEETELTTDEVINLLKLHTFRNMTNIYNSDGGDMYVKYWCDNSIATLMSTKANTSDILPISGGGMQGVLVAQSNTDYTTPQVRNVSMSTEAATGGNNGQIHFQYV